MKKLLSVLMAAAVAGVALVGCKEKTPEEEAAEAMKKASKNMQEAAEEMGESADKTLKDLTGE
jgi:outer membrane lipoprotein-sorting protein